MFFILSYVLLLLLSLIHVKWCFYFCLSLDVIYKVIIVLVINQCFLYEECVADYYVIMEMVRQLYIEYIYKRKDWVIEGLLKRMAIANDVAGYYQKVVDHRRQSYLDCYHHRQRFHQW